MPFLLALAPGTLGAACGSAPESTPPESTASAQAAIDFASIPPTTYTIQLTSVKHTYAVEVHPRDPFWTPDTGYVDWAELAVKVNSDYPKATACSLGPAVNGSVLSNCEAGALNNAVFQQGQPLAIPFTVTGPNDVVTFAIAMDNIESTNPAAVSSSTTALVAAAGDLIAVASLDGPFGAIVAGIGAGLSIAADLAGANNDHDPRLEQSCAGGLMGNAVPISGLPTLRSDTLFFQLTRAQLEQLTASGPYPLVYKAQVNDYCYSLAYINMTLTRDWTTGLAPSPKSGEFAVARQNLAIDWFAPKQALSNFGSLDHQSWSPGQGWRSEAVQAVAGGGITPHTNTVTVARTPDDLDVFWTDNGIHWASWSTASPTWSTGSVPTNNSLPPNANISVTSRMPGLLDLFWIGKDGGIWTSWWAGSGWTTYEIPGTVGVAPNGAPIAATARSAYNIDVFYIGNNGVPWSTYLTNGAWNTINLDPFQNNIAVPGAHLTAVARSTQNLDVFFLGKDGGLYQSQIFPGATAWQTTLINGTLGLGYSGATVSAATREFDQLDVVFGGHLGKLYEASWGTGAAKMPQLASGAWGVFTISTGYPYVDVATPISLVARGTGNLDVYYQNAGGAWWSWYWQQGMQVAQPWPSGTIPLFTECVPTSCSATNAHCGMISDGCGGTKSCGVCSSSLTCNVAHQCVAPTCAAQRCNPGYFWSTTSCSCVRQTACACGGVYPNCKACP